MAHSAFVCGESGNRLVMDTCGQVSLTEQTITVRDTTPPVITATDTTVQCASQATVALVGTPTATDDCGPIASLTSSDTTTALVPACANNVDIVRTWYVVPPVACAFVGLRLNGGWHVLV